jgi:hypothetical protein
MSKAVGLPTTHKAFKRLKIPENLEDQTAPTDAIKPLK